MQNKMSSKRYNSSDFAKCANNIRCTFSLLFTLVLGCLISSQAFAQDCQNLNENETWLNGLFNIQSLFEKGDYATALDIAKNLYEICPDSPTLLYYTGIALEKQGDTERALIYYQKGSENTFKIATPSSISRVIWYKRYEMEHPERTEDAVAAQASKIESQDKQIEELQAVIDQFPQQKQAILEQKAAEIQSLMWTGVGIGGVGIASLVAGAALLGADTNPLGGNYKENPKRVAGWTLLGTGLGLAVAGGIVSGLAGYKYSKAKEDAVMTVSALPMGASFSMTF